MNEDVKVTFKRSELEILQAILEDLLVLEYHTSLREEDIEVETDITNLINKIKKSL